MWNWCFRTGNCNFSFFILHASLIQNFASR